MLAGSFHNPHWQLALLLLALLFGASLPASGQGGRPPVGRVPSGQGSGSFSGFQPDTAGNLIDTFPIFYRYAGDPFREISFSDTLLDDFFNQYDPVRKRRFDYKNLGVPGSAHQPMVYEPRMRRGFDPGFRQYDLYLLPASAVPFYRLQRAYTNLAFYQGPEQGNGYLTAQFSRDFANGLNFSIDYHRLSQIGNQTLFPNQNGRNTALGIGFWFKGKKGRYNGFLSFADNKLEHDDNGGITREPVLEGTFATPSSAEVFLRTAGTRHRHQEFLYTQYFKIGRPDTSHANNDSTRVRKQVLLFSHQIGFRNSTYKFFDDAPDSDAAYYQIFQTDDRGVRQFIGHQKLENSFRLITYRKQTGAEDALLASGGSLELGLTHALHRIDQEPLDSTLQEVFLNGKLTLQPIPRLQLTTQAQLGVLGSLGDYQVKGDLQWSLGKLGQLRATVLNQLYAPTLVQQQFYVTQRLLWQNDYRKTLETNLSAVYAIPRFGLEVGGAYHLLNNLIYFDTAGFSRQTTVPVSIGQLWLGKNFRVWKLHLDNLVVWQFSSEPVVRLPELFGKHSLYFSGKIFKVLDTRIGFDVRYNSSYYADYYFPLTGQFQLQDEQEVAFFPSVDAFVNLKVTKFRAFIKFENLTRLAMSGLFYQTPYYPLPPASAFRIGIKWRFSD